MIGRSETIVAIATAAGQGGIGVVRISGSDLTWLALRLCGRQPTPRKASLTKFLDANAHEIDRGIVLYFPAPHSFTGEDVLELQGHGGPIVMQMLLSRCLELGARLAEPGEFSKRAFLNGKLDLAQAEAVADLIGAASETAARSALRSLSGEFSREVGALVRRLIELRMLVEATLDFPEEEIDPLRDTDVEVRLASLCSELAMLRQRARAGSRLRSGLHVVLAGAPNVGKSSLLNRLTGEDSAIVTDIAGTTRDALRETIFLDGIPLHVVDTAGLRETGDVVERLGIARTWHEIGRADVVLQVVDARVGETEWDRNAATGFPDGVERIVVENKCDLTGRPPGKVVREKVISLRLSAKTGDGLNLLHDELLRVAGWQGRGEDVVLARARHLEALGEAAQQLERAQRQLNRMELCAEELRRAQESLSRITGVFSADDLLGEIFSSFCIGK